MSENMKIATTVLDHLSLAQLLELNDILWAKIVSLNQEADRYETGTQSTPIDEFTEDLLNE